MKPELFHQAIRLERAFSTCRTEMNKGVVSELVQATGILALPGISSDFKQPRDKDGSVVFQHTLKELLLYFKDVTLK